MIKVWSYQHFSVFSRTVIPAMSRRMLMSSVSRRTAATPLKIIGTMPTETAAIANHLSGWKKCLKSETSSSIPQAKMYGLGHFLATLADPCVRIVASSLAWFRALTEENSKPHQIENESGMPIFCCMMKLKEILFLICSDRLTYVLL